MTRKVNPVVILVGALLLIALALTFLVRQVTGPGETINDYSKIPPKGAGKFDKQPGAGL